MLYTKCCKILAESVAHDAAPSNVRSHLQQMMRLPSACRRHSKAACQQVPESATVAAWHCCDSTCPHLGNNLCKWRRITPQRLRNAANVARTSHGLATCRDGIAEDGSILPDASLTCQSLFRITSADARCTAHCIVRLFPGSSVVTADLGGKSCGRR
jgi:hypothetical protein